MEGRSIRNIMGNVMFLKGIWRMRMGRRGGLNY
jgi:hypothetical protein